MNIVIITAHPSALGETHRIAKTYADAQILKKNTAQIVNLYEEENKIENLAFEKINEFTPSKLQKKFQEQILWAHEIVVVHPIWWGTPPSIMKSWVELTFWPKVAYHYSPKGELLKLLTGKTAKVFVTCGGPSWWHHFLFMPLLSFWKLCVFEFCGVDLIDFKVCGKLDILKDKEREKHIQKFLEKIKNS